MRLQQTHYQPELPRSSLWSSIQWQSILLRHYLWWGGADARALNQSSFGTVLLDRNQGLTLETESRYAAGPGDRVPIARKNGTLTSGVSYPSWVLEKARSGKEVRPSVVPAASAQALHPDTGPRWA